MDEVQRIIVEVLNADRVRQLNKEYSEAEKRLVGLNKRMQEGKSFALDYGEAMRATASVMNMNREELNRLQPAGPGHGFRDRFGAMFAGQALGGVIRSAGSGNLQGAVGNLGMLGQQAAMMSSLSPQAIIGISAVASLFEVAIANTEKIVAALKGVDLQKVQEAKTKAEQLQKEMDALMATPKPSEAAAASSFKGGMAQAGMDLVQSDLTMALGQPGVMTPATRAEINKYISDNSDELKSIPFGASPETQRAIREENRQVAEQRVQAQKASQEARRLMTDSVKPGPEGEAARKRLETLLPPDVLAKMKPRWRDFVGPPQISRVGHVPGSVGPPIEASTIPGLPQMLPGGSQLQTDEYGRPVPGVATGDELERLLGRPGTHPGMPGLPGPSAKGGHGTPDGSHPLEQEMNAIDRSVLAAEARSLQRDAYIESMLGFAGEATKRLMEIKRQIDALSSGQHDAAAQLKAMQDRARMMWPGQQMGQYSAGPTMY